MTSSTAFFLDPPRDATLIGPYRSPVVQAVVRGLLPSPRSLPRWLAGVSRGSAVEVEAAIVDEHARDIARFVGSSGGRISVVDLGDAGDLKDLVVEALVQQHVMATGIVVDDDVDALAEVPGPRCVLWLGASFSAVEPRSAETVLHRLAGKMGEGDWLVIGAAQRPDKDHELRRFHQRMLERVNREAGANFSVERWGSRSSLSRDGARVHSHLESTCDQEVLIDGLGLSLWFKKGERIDTGSRPVWSDDAVAAALEDAGFARDVVFVDEDEDVAVHLARL